MRCSSKPIRLSKWLAFPTGVCRWCESILPISRLEAWSTSSYLIHRPEHLARFSRLAAHPRRICIPCGLDITYISASLESRVHLTENPSLHEFLGQSIANFREHKIETDRRSKKASPFSGSQFSPPPPTSRIFFFLPKPLDTGNLGPSLSALYPCDCHSSKPAVLFSSKPQQY